MHPSRALSLFAAGVMLLAAGCGDSEADPEPTATDTSSGASAEPTPEPTPEVAPEDLDPGQYPDFEPTDYTYTLQVSCFCPDANIPIEVTVANGEATQAAYLESGQGGPEVGEEAPDFALLTIQDIIDDANDTSNAEVIIEWPAGQAWPSFVSIDRDERIADEESTYTLSDVEVG